MQKLISIMAALLLSVVSFAQTEKPQANAASFGRYGSDCSSGRGVCSFVVSNANEKSGRVISKKVSDSRLSIEILRKQLSKTDEISIAGKPFASVVKNEQTTFLQSELMTLDANTLKNLNIDLKYNAIQPGNYPMQITEDKVTIVFTLSPG